MKKFFSKKSLPVFMLLAAALLSFCATAQPAKDSLPLYKQFPFIPSFKLMKVDSSFFSMKEVIPKKQAAVVIIFSPTCSHCQHQAEEITSHIKDFSDVTFLFATGYPVSEMKQYISDYGLDRFPNIFVGQDKALSLASFYKVQSIPGIFVYNKKGNLAAEFNTNVKADKLVDALKK